jgi:peptidoglycan hydrolase CwlO-like protein
MRRSIAIAMIMSVLFAGCATGRDQQSEVDDLNSKTANLQKQLQEKNQSIGVLQDTIRSLKQKVDEAEQAARDAVIRLDAALSKLTRAQGGSASGYDKKSESYVK